MNILHVSDNTHSGSPIRIVDLFNKYTEHRAKHLVWEPITGYRKFKVDMVSSSMPQDEIMSWFRWADFICYHNKYKSQSIFKKVAFSGIPERPAIIQIHSPREKIDSEVLDSGLPLAIVAQYHVRQWPEANHIVPNVVDIFDPAYQRAAAPPTTRLPVVSYAPSNWNAKGWDDKGYGVVAPLLKRLKLEGIIDFQPIVMQPHNKAMAEKKKADIGIDEIATGSYHLSSLEYLSLGIPCFANLDNQTEAVVKNLTGASFLPWVKADKSNFRSRLLEILPYSARSELGRLSRQWMEQFWNPEVLVSHYMKAYKELV